MKTNDAIVLDVARNALTNTGWLAKFALAVCALLAGCGQEPAPTAR